MEARFRQELPVMRTLNELAHLKDTGFGQPYPRHGLSLLWWFAHACVKIDQNGGMFALYDPEEGHFGFHEFHNEEELLPDTDLTYYEVGNLSNHHHHPGTFPPVVTQNYDSDDPDSNTDRIIVSVDSSQRIEQIYVTEHSDEDGFDESCTYRISQGLIRIIQNLERSDFISEVIIRRRRRNRR
ncbi:hypothetical protein E1301_Tti012130 [Triplophysa tibetana]|uniref:Uncharacterized protein n=1 Tax=Triplophysa tibetana TaxID=1572043 RepID=A0A5A9PM79_9TELE|nr:hypothetical protein E1301_Tti012130 [Triplophysa tibetana]